MTAQPYADLPRALQVAEALTTASSLLDGRVEHDRSVAHMVADALGVETDLDEVVAAIKFWEKAVVLS